MAAPSLEPLVRRFETLSCRPGDSDEQRSRKAHFTLAMTMIIPAGVLWGAIYLAFGARVAALMPLAYSALSVLNLVFLQRTGRFRPYQAAQIALIVVLPFALQLALGGFVGGSAVVIWALLGPLFAVLFTTPTEARIWFGVFVAEVLVAGIAQPSLTHDNALPSWLVAVFFVMNVGSVSTIAFAILTSFMSQREHLRALEVAYLEQTVMLRQREKLATLGTLAAGVAHELNNPAAAVRRSADQLAPELEALGRSFATLAASPVIDEQLAHLVAALDRRPAPSPLSPLEQSEREQEVEDWLDERGVPAPWDLAALLVAEGYAPEELGELVEPFEPDQGGAVCALVAHVAASRHMATSIAEGAARISDIVGAMRSYSYLDRGTVQLVDITEGLESTLVLLQSRLRDVQVRREYEPDLPRVQVRGSELNQVWTNLIHNAADATDGSGTIVVRVRHADAGVAVEVEDDGPGIPAEVVDRVFDPFFTTKAPGQGTGLGLNISHNIVVNQHGGSIAVISEPGRTCFRVELPVAVPTEASDGVERNDTSIAG